MSIEFEFVQDYRKYRKYLTYITKADEAMGLHPFTFYQGDMLDCYVVELVGSKLTVTLSNNTDPLVNRFAKEAQASSFEGIAENTAFLYDIARHELIYNFDTKEASTYWNWSTYPDVYWMNEEDKHDHGLALDTDGNPVRMFLGNDRLISLFVSLSELNDSFPKLHQEGTAPPTLLTSGTELTLSIFASHLGQTEPKTSEVVTAIACDMLAPEGDYPEYRFKELVELFELKGATDDLYQDEWVTGIEDALALDNMRDERTLGAMTIYPDQLCLSELNDLSVVPQVDRITYVHMDIPINGIHYMAIYPDQMLCVYFDDLIIKADEIYTALENLPQEQISLQGDYEAVSDEDYDNLNKSGLSYTDDELGTSGIGNGTGPAKPHTGDV